MESTTPSGVLSAFSLSAFDPAQETDQEKASYEAVPSSVSCFSEVAVTQDGADLPSNSQMAVEGFETSTTVTPSCQDNLLNTHVTVLSVPDSSLFQVQPPSQLHVTQQEVSLTQEQVAPDDESETCVPEIIAGQSGITSDTHNSDRLPPLPPNIQHVIINTGDSPIEDTDGAPSEEPKKRKGGWPKGKKRKKEFVDVNKPRAPVTGYVRFLNKRRTEVKQDNPHLLFHEITKLLGVEWSNLETDEKQKYLDQAEEDKKRYVEELKAYQQSEQYQAYIKRQHTKRVKSFLANPEVDSNFVLCQDAGEDDDPNELYCRTCDQYFSSQHNRREHMYGRQHLQMLTEDFEREAEQIALSSNIPGSANPAKLTHGPEDALTLLISHTQPLSVSQFTEKFMEQNLNRELELRELRKSVVLSQEEHLSLSKEVENAKVMLQKAESDFGSTKVYGASLNVQLDNLRLVPNIFGISI